MDDVLNHAPCGFAAFSDQGEILEANATLLDLLGLPPGALLGARFESILTIASRIFLQTHFFPLLALHGKADEVFLTLLARDQSHIPMFAYAKRDKGRNICVFVPVRERHKYEQEILHAKREAEEALRSNRELLAAKGQLEAHAHELDRRIAESEQRNRELLQVTKILFHDLREPIRKIETFSNLMLTGPALDMDSMMSVSKISDACSSANRLLRALQKFVSVETAEANPEPVDLGALSAAGYQRVRLAYPDCVSQLTSDPLPEIQGYPRQLRLLFDELYENAFRFRRKGDALLIRLAATLIQENSFRTIRDRYRYIDFLQIFFSDNGVGIPEQHRELVFEPFKKLDTGNPEPGCGLAVCRKVIANHFGSIHIVPHTGPGTAFRILIPVRQEKLFTESV